MRPFLCEQLNKMFLIPGLYKCALKILQLRLCFDMHRNLYLERVFRRLTMPFEPTSKTRSA